MKRNILAICDPEAMYAYNLMEYIHGRQGNEFEVQVFTSADSLLDYVKENKVEMLLVSDEVICERVRKLDIGRIVILSQGEQIRELEEYPSIYKYQPADGLVKEVMEYYAQVKAQPPPSLFKQPVEVTAVYSPVKRSGKTSFALTYGQLLANSQAVLYLNLEDYAGFEGLMGKSFSSDISDLMYFCGQGKGNFLCRLKGMTYSINNMDYVPPAFSPFDLRSIRACDWLALIEELAVYSSYDVILLDIGEQVDNLPEILRRCGKIYMPVREDSIAMAKLVQYEKLMLARDYEDVLEKTRKIKVPYHNNFGKKEHYVEQLIWGELGDYVRRMIREEEANH